MAFKIMPGLGVIFSLSGSEKGATRGFDLTIMGVGAAGWLVMWAAGIGKFNADT